MQVTALAITMSLPITANMIVSEISDKLQSRAKKTPLIFGAKGDRFDLAINSLFFRGAPSSQISMLEYKRVKNENRGSIVPIILGFTAKEYPVVGTTTEYFLERNLASKSGTLPLVLGDVTLGYLCAKKLNLKEGDHILTDQVNLYNLSANNPVKLNITGILKESKSADDETLFVNLQTSWLLSGIGHGHVKIDDKTSSESILSKNKSSITANASLENYIEVTDENINSFHFHKEQESLPISSLLAFPRNIKDETILKGNYINNKTIQSIRPREIVNELLEFVFKIKRFLNTSFILTGIAALLFLLALILLSIQTRKREIKTLFLIGCDRKTLALLFIGELVILSSMALLVSIITAYALKGLAIGLIV